MKNLFKKIITTVVVGGFAATVNVNAQSARPKIPHSHHTEHDGQVLMFGDDHIEVVGTSGSEQVTLYVGDKMRAAVPLVEVKLSAEVVNGETVTPLTVVASAKAKNVGLVMIPKDLQKTGVLKIQSTRINPPKGHLSVNTAQSLPLNKLFK